MAVNSFLFTIASFLLLLLLPSTTVVILVLGATTPVVRTGGEVVSSVKVCRIYSRALLYYIL